MTNMGRIQNDVIQKSFVEGFTSPVVDQPIWSKLLVAWGFFSSAHEKELTHSGKPYILTLGMTIEKEEEEVLCLPPRTSVCLKVDSVLDLATDSQFSTGPP